MGQNIVLGGDSKMRGGVIMYWTKMQLLVWSRNDRRVYSRKPSMNGDFTGNGIYTVHICAYYVQQYIHRYVQ